MLGLLDWLRGAQRIVIVGVGNPLRKDDNVGVEIVRGLVGRTPEPVLLIESETVPEEFIGQIVDFKPTHILIIDAAILGLTPGSARFVERVETSRIAVSTHTLPIQIFCEYLAKVTAAKVAWLLIQPKDTGFGEGLTRELDSERERIVNYLAKVLETVLK
ncbi:MAG: hydrogenase maturation protease [Candidatus Bathyarchaeia archaeon]